MAEDLLVLLGVCKTQAQLAGGPWTDQNRIVPRQFRDGVREFLEPAVVVVTAIVNLCVAVKNDIHAVEFRTSGFW